MFCAGANIFMLAALDARWKVNFCKFTNETRNGIEDASAHSGLTFLAAVNGTAAGGGYELALACDEILLVDDNSSAVSLPEVPLLGVLPGTGGLTRVVDKRGVRRDLADVFSTTAEGVRGAAGRRVAARRRASPRPATSTPRSPAGPPRWRARSTRPGAGARGVAAHPAAPGGRRRHHPLRARARGPGPRRPARPRSPCWARRRSPPSVDELHAQGDAAWLLAATRELDDADPAAAHQRARRSAPGCCAPRATPPPPPPTTSSCWPTASDWLVNETIGFWSRTLKRLDTTSRSLFALIEPGSCFAGALAEIALAADRQYMLEGQFEDDEDPAPPAVLRLDAFNTGLLPMGNGLTRLQVRFLGSADDLAAAEAAAGRDLRRRRRRSTLGLVTATPDDIDWEDEIRLVVEERASFSPDALTGMEANLRFAGPETPETKVFGRLTAWQNWIFQRPNAAGPEGALRRYGTGQRAAYDRKRV